MRTTVTLEPDVQAELLRLQQEQGVTFKHALNGVLRAGLQVISQKSRPGPRFETKTANLGRCLLGNIDDVAGVLPLAEGESLR